MKCEKCEKEHNGQYGSGRFCSSTCARSFSSKEKRSLINEKISLKLKGTGNPKITKECPVCTTTFIVNYNKRNQIHCTKKCASDSEIVKEKIAIKMRVINKGSNNPMFGKSPSHTKRINFYSDKNKIELVLKSSYELAAVRILEQDDTVHKYLYESLIIPYKDINGNDKNYIPDFFVNDNKIVEIKPRTMLTIWNNKEKSEAGINYSKENNIEYVIWTEKNLNLKIK